LCSQTCSPPGGPPLLYCLDEYQIARFPSFSGAGFQFAAPVFPLKFPFPLASPPPLFSLSSNTMAVSSIVPQDLKIEGVCFLAVPALMVKDTTLFLFSSAHFSFSFGFGAEGTIETRPAPQLVGRTPT